MQYENIFDCCKEEFNKVMTDADSYLKKENVLLTLAKDVYEKKGRAIPLTDFETRLYGIPLKEGDSIFDLVSKTSRLFFRPVLKNWNTDTKSYLEENIPLISIDSYVDRDLFPYLSSVVGKSGDVAQVHLTLAEENYESMCIHGLQNEAHSGKKKSIVYLSGQVVADIADVLSYLSIFSQVKSACSSLYAQRSSGLESLDMLFRLAFNKLLEKESIYCSSGKLDISSDITLILPETFLPDLPTQSFEAMEHSSRTITLLNSEEYSELCRNIAFGTDITRFQLPDNYFMLSTRGLYLYALYELFVQGKDLMSYHDILPRGRTGSRPYFPIPIKHKHWLYPVHLDVLSELFTILWEQRSQQMRTERYMDELHSDYAKSFMTKANIPMKQLQAMETSLLNSYFGFVEYDAMTDIEAVREVEREFVAVKESYFPFLDTSMASIRFRRLGNHKAAGLYYPFFHCVCVDVRYPHSLLHEIGHMIDYSYGKLSCSADFLPVKQIYMEHLQDVQSGDSDAATKLKGNTKYNLSYYKEDTEIFARCFEVYLSYCKGIKNSLLPAEFGWAYATDDVSVSLIKNYFDTLFEQLTKKSPQSVADSPQEMVASVVDEEPCAHNETVRWLIGTPSSDGNFKSHLKDATIDDLQEALSVVKQNPKAASKVKILERALKKLNKEHSVSECEPTKKLLRALYLLLICY